MCTVRFTVQAEQADVVFGRLNQYAGVSYLSRFNQSSGIVEGIISFMGHKNPGYYVSCLQQKNPEITVGPVGQYRVLINAPQKDLLIS